MRLIDADALERDGWQMSRTVQVSKDTMEYQVRKPTDFPTIEPQRMRGRWESTVIGKARHIRCSSCKVGYYAKDVPHDLSGNVAWKYCPECGAEMEEQEC